MEKGKYNVLFTLYKGFIMGLIKAAGNAIKGELKDQFLKPIMWTLFRSAI